MRRRRDSYGAGSDGLLPRLVAPPHLDQGAQTRRQGRRDLEPGAEVAHVDMIPVDDEPPADGAQIDAGEPEAHDGPGARPRIQQDAPLQIPEQQVRIEILLPHLGNPSQTPRPQILDDAAQLSRAGCSARRGNG